MKFTMNQQTATISFAIIFFLVLGLYLAFFGAENPEVSSPTVITEVSDEEEPLPKFTGDVPEIIPERDEEGATAPEPVNTGTPPPIFDSFDEEALGEEFDDIQAGIDLLNNPLR